MKYNIEIPVQTYVTYYGIEADSRKEAIEIFLKTYMKGLYNTDTSSDYWEENLNTATWTIEEEGE